MGRQRWLGFLAIGLGVLALFAAMPRHGWDRHIRVETRPAGVAAPVAPAMPPQPGPFFDHGGPRVWAAHRMHHGWHGGPGFLIDGLLKVAMIFVLTALGLRLLRGRHGP